MAAKRIGREPSPTDLGYKLIDAKMKQMLALRELADHPSLGDTSWGFSTYHSGLQDWNDPKIVALVTALAALDPDEQELRDYPETNTRDWVFEWKFEDDYSIRVSVCAYLAANAPGACRRIQIGTKMVEQPIYRNECAPPAEYAPDAALPAPVLNLEAL